jgi:hypothetical protein
MNQRLITLSDAAQRIFLRRYLFRRRGPPAIVPHPVGGRMPDAFLCSHPKSGRTWVRFSLANYLRITRGLDVEVDFKSAHSVTPAVHTGIAGIESEHFAYPEREDVPLVAASHWPYASGRFPGVTILLLRDPRDVVVSQFHAVTKHKVKFQGPFEDYLHRRDMGPRSVARYLDSWVPWAARHRDRVITYERWFRSPEDGLAELLAHLGIEADRAAIAEACAASAFDRMRQIEHETHRPVTPESDPDSRFVRRGRPGGWRELPPEHAAMLDAALRRWLTPRARELLATQGLWSAPPR